MKFSCDRCSARYQIPDEKVAGKRLRYTCRKCQNSMVLDGSALVLDAGVFDVAPAAADPSEPLTPKSIPPSVVPSSSALFGVSTPPPRVSTPPPRVSTPPPRVSTPPSPATLPELPVWHVAIRGVPVGPLRKSEVAARAAAGDVARSSLAWREGLADWAAIASIPELAAVVKTPAAASPPAIEPSPAVEPPLEVETTEAVEPPLEVEPSPTVEPPLEVETTARSTRDASATAASDFARAVVAAQPAAPAPARSAHEPDVAPSASLDPLDSTDAMPRRTNASRPWWPALVVGAILGAIGIAYLAGKPSGGDVTTAPANAPSTQNPPTAANDSQRPPETSPGLAQDSIEDVGDDSYLAELAGVVDAGSPSRVDRPEETPQATRPAADVVDESPLPMPVATRDTPRTGTPNGDSFETHVNTTRSGPSGPLDAAQISAVVRANRARAQRCYERAATMSGTAPDVRLSISVRIAPSGNVSNVEVAGNDFGGVVSCVERVVSSWQFPASTAGGQTTFSLVFAGS